MCYLVTLIYFKYINKIGMKIPEWFPELYESSKPSLEVLDVRNIAIQFPIPMFRL